MIKSLAYCLRMHPLNTYKTKKMCSRKTRGEQKILKIIQSDPSGKNFCAADAYVQIRQTVTVFVS